MRGVLALRLRILRMSGEIACRMACDQLTLQAKLQTLRTSYGQDDVEEEVTVTSPERQQAALA